jgi:membrane protein
MADDSLSKIQSLQEEARSVLDESAVSPADEERLPRLHRIARFWVMVVQSFLRNRCPVRATALAYTTLLALVPVLAVVISISTSLLKTEKGQEQMDAAINGMIDKLAPQLGLVSQATGDSADARNRVMEVIKGAIQNMNSGALGATAMVGIIFVGISLLANIETTINDIWGVTRGRTWFARVVQYWAVMTLGPLLLLVAASLMLGSHTSWVQDALNKLPLVQFFYDLIPLVLVTVGLGVFYKLMPNTKVEWRAAFIGGFVAALLWGLNNQFNVVYFGQVVRNSKIYGSLGILPIFLVGLYLSWLILLFGAQVAYAFQNRRAYIQERQADVVNEESREFIALRLMNAVAERFERGEKPATLGELSDALGISSRLLTRILVPLLKTKLLVEVRNAETGYSPGRPLEKITYQDIIQAIRSANGQAMSTKEGPVREKVTAELDRIRAAERKIAESVTLAEAVRAPLGSQG